MASRYWVGGTANWDGIAGAKWATTSGGAGGASVPTAADEVYFDANSGTGTVTVPSATTVVCRRLDFTGFTGTLSIANSVTAVISIGDATAATGNAALILSTGMGNLSGLGGNGIINFVSTSATQQTITSNGRTIPSVTFSGAGSSYLLSDGMTMASTATLNHNAGTLDSNSLSHTWPIFNSTGATTRTLTLGSSAISCNTWTARGSNYTFTANTATVTQSGANANFDNNTLCPSNNYNGMSLVQLGSGTANVGFAGVSSSLTTLANYTRTGTATLTDNLVISTGGLTCTGTFTSNGNSTTNRIKLQSGLIGTSSTITAATVSVSNSNFADITGAGAGSWNLAGATGGTGDCLGNSGITFTTAVTRYAAMAGNASSTSMWSTSSGGSTGASVPLPQDNLVFDDNSGAGTYVMDMPDAGANLTCTGFTRTLRTSSTVINFYGNVILGSGMTLNNVSSASWAFVGRGSQTFTSNGASFSNSSGVGQVVFSAPGGSYTLQDAMSVTSGTINIRAGTFSSNNYSITTPIFGYTNIAVATTINLGTSTVNLTGTSGTPWGFSTTTGLTFNGSNATIIISTASPSTRTFAGGALNYGTLTYTVAGSTGSLSITGSSYFDRLNFSDTANARSLSLQNSSMQTIKDFNVFGTVGKVITIFASSNTAYLKLVGNPGTSNDYLSIQDVYSVIPDKFYAGANSTNISGNTNVIFTAYSGARIRIYQVYGVSGTSLTSFPISLPTSPPAGSLLVGVFTCPGNPGTITLPSGFTLVDSSNDGTNVSQTFIYSKIADGTETNADMSTSSAQSGAWVVYNVNGFSGTPTYDTSSKRSGAGANITSLLSNSGTPPVNTSAPAFGVVGLSGNSTLSASVSVTNGFVINRDANEANNGRTASIYLSGTGNVETTYTWTTGRRASILLAVFKDVATTTGRVKVKIGGVFVEKPGKIKLSGSFVEKPTKVKIGGTFTTL